MDSLTVIIVSHGHGRYLPALLQSLGLQEDVQLGVHLIFNVPEHYEVYRSLGPYKKLLQLQRRTQAIGLAQNWNDALKKVESEYCLLLNPDTMLTHSLHLRNMLEYLKSSNAQFLSCRSKAFDEAPMVNIRPFPKISEILQARILGQEDRQHRQEQLIQTQLDGSFWVQGSYLLGKRQNFLALGFDERFDLYFEDVDFCERAWRRGLRLRVHPMESFYHHFQAESRSNAIRFLQHLLSATRYFCRI